MKEHQATLPEYVQSSSYSTPAIVQARSGQPIDEALRRAEKTALRMGEHHSYTDPPLPVFILNTGLAWYHQRDYQRAWQTLSRVVDPVTLQVRRPLPERTRIEVINVMAAISLKAPEKDMERSQHLWKAGMNGAQNLQSEQRFTEALSTYHIMEALWPGDQCIGELREFITHW